MRHADILRSQLYWVCEKSDGIRTIIYCTPEATYIVDRKFQFFEVRCPLYSQRLAKDGAVMLDGELIAKDDEWAFMAFDCLQYAGATVTHAIFSERLAQSHKAVKAMSGGDGDGGEALPFRFLEKQFLHFHDIHFLCGKIREVGDHKELHDPKRGLHFKTDGFVLTPEHNNYMHTQATLPLLKWKWPGLNTIDFGLRAPWFDERSGDLTLFVGGEGMWVRVSSIEFSESERAVFLARVGDARQVIAEAGFDIQRGKWILKQFRFDKTTPNFVVVAFQTMEVALEGVGVDKLRTLAQPPSACLACRSLRR